MTWEEIDSEARLGTIPAERMKTGVAHRVPLTDAMLRILEPMRAMASTYVFEGQKRHRPLSNMSMLMLLRRMGRGDSTVHGFRSTFRDWAAEAADAPREGQDALIFDALRDSRLRIQSGDMSDLYWLTDAQMAHLEPFFPKSHGKPRVDDKRVLSGIIFINRNGLRWRDAPAAFGPHKTLYSRWKRWSEKGIFARMTAGLAAEHGEEKTVMIEATYLKAHRTATSMAAKKGGAVA